MSMVASDGESLVAQAIRNIREHIRQNKLRVGDPLPGEQYFAAALGVSRAVMREAFGALAALRVIDVANGRRARVGAIDGSVLAASLDHAVATAQVSIGDIWDVRRTLELRTVELAALHRTLDEAHTIIAHAEAMCAAAGDGETITRCDIALHQAIAGASRNVLFFQIVRSFEPMMRVAVPAAWRTRVTQEQRTSMLEHHLHLARTIADGDPVRAVAAMNAHFDASIGRAVRQRALTQQA